MKRLLLIPALLLTAAAATAQTVTHENDPKQERVQVVENSQPEVFTVVEEMPEFPGGAAAMNTYIEKNLRYPESAKKDSVRGNVYVKFIIDKTGEINAPSVIKGLAGCSECNAEAIRVVKSMPKWTPGKQNGQNVPVYFNLAVRFKLDAPKEVFTPVEVMPEFPGGPAAMMKFINKNMQYPADLRDKGIGGKVFIRFVVKADSTIENIQVTRSDGWIALDKEAIRVISIMPKWRPGSQNGKAVNVFFNVPVSFSAKNPAPDIELISGKEYYKKTEYSKALAHFLQALKKNQYDSESAYFAGECYIQLGEPVKACEIWTKLKQMKNSSADELLKKHCSQ